VPLFPKSSLPEQVDKETGGLLAEVDLDKNCLTWIRTV